MQHKKNSIIYRVNIRRQRHIFSKFRREGLKVAASMFLLFGVLDFIYMPKLAPLWLILRSLFAVSMFLTLKMLKKSKIRRTYSEALVVFNQVFACSIISFMIAQTGGYKSLYLIGLILTSMIAINIFRISTFFTSISLILSYLPTLIIISVTGGVENWTTVLIYTFFFASFFILHFVFAIDDVQIQDKAMSKEAGFKDQITKFQRTEILKRQFPEAIRRIIESGENIPTKKFIPDAVVGFADISNSTSLANQLSLQKDWELKEAFIENATRLATQHGFVVLTQLGDGFLFLANYDQNRSWHVNLFSFFEALLSEFEQMKRRIIPNIDHEKIGLRCSAAMGACIVGFLGKEQTYFTAIGPDVNLAARLCGKATVNELIITAHIWNVIRHVLSGVQVDRESYNDLKGFDNLVTGFRIPLGSSNSKIICPQCQNPMQLIKTGDGLYDMVCSMDHSNIELGQFKKVV